MKKIVISLCLIVCVLGVSKAQDLKFGIKAGLNLASIGGDSFGTASFSSRTAYHAGIFAEIPLISNFSVQPEVLYSAQGSEFGGLVGFSGIDSTKLDYVNIPVMVKYNIILGLSAEVGPVVGILVSAKGPTIDNNGNTVEGDIKDNFQTLDVGVGIGVSYAFDFGLIAGIRYNKGVTNINDIDTAGKNQNNLFQVWVGYSFL